MTKQLILLVFFISFIAHNAISQELMEIEGAITLQNSSSSEPAEGTIRWNSNSQDFEGYDGSTWLSLTIGSTIEPSLPPMTEEKQYTAVPNDPSNLGGYAVAIEGEYAFVGAPGVNSNQGAVHVFKYVGDQWIENQTLLASNGVSGDGFGSSIAVSENWAIIGAYYKDELGNSNSGKVYFFYFDGIDWSQQQWMAEPIGIRTCLDIKGVTAVVGIPFIPKGTKSNVGGFSIYQFNGNTWNRTDLLLDINVIEAEAMYGNAIAISDDWIVIGAANQDGPSTPDQGKIQIYKNTGNIWQYHDEIVNPIAQPVGKFGFSVDVSDDLMVVSAPGETVNGKVLAGAVYVYIYTGGQWQLQDKLTIGNPEIADLFGHSVAIGGDHILVGSILRDVNGSMDQGFVGRYTFNGSNWKIVEEYFDPDSEDNGQYGWDIATDGVHRIVGMPMRSHERGKVVIGRLGE